MNPQARVLVRPFYPDFLQNKLFSFSVAQSDRWMEPYVKWWELATARGMSLDTWDMHPLDTADIVLFLDLPGQRRELDEARQKAPQARFMLMLVESPSGRPQAFNPKNHTDFDLILTYNWRLCDDKRYFRYYLPIGTSQTCPNPPFAERKPLLLMNTNRLLGPFGLLATRQPGLRGLPFLGHLFSGWSVSPSALLGQVRGELYSRRRQLARLADREFPGMLDIYGSGWQGEPIGWVSKLAKPKPYASARGRFRGKKDDLIASYRFAVAFENAVGDVGYISEKIFDALLAGVVPLYLGDERIAEHVDPACFLDARRFASDRDLLTFVRDCSETDWHRLREAGQKYIASDAAKKFQTDAFAHRMVETLEIVARKSR